MRAKARQGHFPGTAPFGYLNNPATKTIVVDRKKAPIVKAAFELYSKNDSTLDDISQFLFNGGVKSYGGFALHKNRIKFVLANPFYYGQFLYGGELYEGKHLPLITKALFDKVQKVMLERSHPQVFKVQPQAFCGLMFCGECGFMITAEKQKGHVYYRCTKKAALRCSQRYTREEQLAADFSDLISMFVLSEKWARDFEHRMKIDSRESGRTTAEAVARFRSEIVEIGQKLDRLMDLYISQDIERDLYLAKRRALMSDKRTKEEQILSLEKNSSAWLEPMSRWINEAENLAQIQNAPSLPAKKSALQKIFGSNLKLQNQKVSGTAHPLYAAVAAARENPDHLDSVSVVVPGERLELSRLASVGFESTAFTISPPRQYAYPTPKTAF